MENRRNPRNPTTKKVEEIPHRSLIGNIVEKGFSSSSTVAFTSPTVLPFPVARHRSHGPHWAPVGAVVNEAEEDEDEDDEDGMDYDAIAGLAEKVRRKEKRTVDFSRWRKLVSGEGPARKVESLPGKVRKVKSCTVPEKFGGKSEFMMDGGRNEIVGGGHNHKVESTNGDANFDPLLGANDGKHVVCENFGSKSRFMMDGRRDEMVDVGCNVESTNGVANFDANYGNHVVMSSKSSLEEDIDAENRARLNEMSPDEIAEAQAEMMRKMSPARLEMLKKRGRDKLGVKKDDSRVFDKDMSNSSLKSKVQDEGGKDPKQSVSAVGEFVSSGVHDTGLWKGWSERVERARETRFSLDGNVVESEDGCCQYKVENVAERDLLRTEGDPLAAGYTIKEAVALSRSVISGQRLFALRLLASVLDKALKNLHDLDTRLNMRNIANTPNTVDWQAVWAYILGPEPEIALSLRIALDDNHNSVVLACAKAIESILCCHLNEYYFNISEKSFIHQKGVCTAPVFRARPEIVYGFLHGGFWKYNTKPSNILPSPQNIEDDEGKHTIQDDVVVAGQDIAVGLVRMGILPRICYLLEMDPLPSLEDSLLSILTGLARHSPTCTSAIMKCPRLLPTVVSRFAKSTSTENYPSQIKSVTLLKVISEADKQNCIDFIKRGLFQQITWQLYKPPVSLDDWMKSGSENRRQATDLMIQQLRLWKVYIRYGYCLVYFQDFFPAMCFWLNIPQFNKLIEKDLLVEFTSVATEAYLVLEALSQRLPNLHSLEQLDEQAKNDEYTETWSWNHAVPMVEFGSKWLILKNHSFSFEVEDQTLVACHELEVVSSVMHMMSAIFSKIAACDSSPLPWLPDFVPKVGLEVVKNGFLDLLNSSGREHQVATGGWSLVKKLCHSRCHGDFEMSLASVNCLHGLVCLLNSIDRLIQRAKASKPDRQIEGSDFALEGTILEEGIFNSGQNELAGVLNMFLDLIPSRWKDLQSVEMFGRGGPAPGVGVGWGSSGGGFWSTSVLLAEADAQLILSLLEIVPIVSEKDLNENTDTRPINHQMSEFTCTILRKINSLIAICTVARPEHKPMLEKVFDILLRSPILKSLDICIHHFLHLKGYKPFEWNFVQEDYLLYGNVLNAHLRNRWLSARAKHPKLYEKNPITKSLKKKEVLKTISEESEAFDVGSEHQDNMLLHSEWAHQRLPLPIHWFLSPISTVGDTETAHFLLGSSKVQNKDLNFSKDASDVVKGGLFFLLGLEAMCYFLCIKKLDSPVMGVPLVWKIHALSMALLVRIEVFDELKSRNIFECLQAAYGENLVQPQHQSSKHCLERRNTPSSDDVLTQGTQSSFNEEILDFQTMVHASYDTFVGTFVEQFASISYGDVIYGRQIAVYLHRSVGLPVRLAAWNALNNALVLDLLPPLESCMGEAKGYLEPIEDNEGMLEAYIKSWITGALDKASARGSMSFMLALHHLSSFIFNHNAPEKLTLRNKMVKSILRGLSRKKDQEGMMLKFINYDRHTSQDHNIRRDSLLQRSEYERRFSILSEACEGNYSLIVEVEKLRSTNNQIL